jgi:hypothetical protein
LFALKQKRIYDPKATCSRQKEYIGGGVIEGLKTLILSKKSSKY